MTSVIIMAPCSPPATPHTNRHALRPRATCFLDCSTALLSIGRRPSRTKMWNAFQCRRIYPNASAKSLFGNPSRIGAV
jgi:hypothetical protein